MLKKIAYAAATSGLLFVSLGASAMVNESPFPPCYGVECSALHDGAKNDGVAASSEVKMHARSHDKQAEKQARTSASPFPFDNSKD